MARNYPEPFVPTNFSCRVTKAATTLTTVDRRTGYRRRKSADRWDVNGRADGVEYSKRFPRAGLAESWKERLERGYASGLPFDLRAKCFIVPQPDPSRDVATVFSITEQFYRGHPEWEPKTKILAATAFNRARRWLLPEGFVLEGAARSAVVDYLDHASFTTPDRAGLTDRQAVGLAWLEAHSQPAADVTTAQIEEFVRRFETSQRNPKKKVAAATIVRYTQPLRACWAWAVARDDIPVSQNPWLAVRARRKVKTKAQQPASGHTRLAVDKDIVLDVPQAIALADRCAQVGSWGGVVSYYVLVMALCGLRPNEAVGLLWEDVELPPDDSPGWLKVRRSRRRVAARWLDPDEDPEWGPLKDRSTADTRRVPVPPFLVQRLHSHRQDFGEGPDGLVFHRRGRPFDLSLFARDVWEPARAEMFPPRKNLAPGDPRQPKLSRLRRHDLRHAACSWWLRSGVDATVCQRWSGHKSLSVFLDVYQGVAPGREDDGVQKLVRSLAEVVGR
jgi:integrase